MRIFIWATMVASIAAIPSDPTPLHLANSDTRIPGSYIVVLKPGASMVFTKSSLSLANVRVEKELHALNMITVRMEDTALEKVRAMNDVLYIQEDGIVKMQAVAWGLDRIDQRNSNLNNEYSPTGTGSGVNVYVIDSGINSNHLDFEGRAEKMFDATGGDGVDCFGHGTHCAGTVAGSTWGVAKSSKIFSVRVFGCSDSAAWETVLSAMNHVLTNAVKPAVVSMSLGGKGRNAAVKDAVDKLYDAGIVVSVAAGNDRIDACNVSPAYAPKAITVGATDKDDSAAWFTNYGSCVDIYAPGVDIESAEHTSNTASITSSGTSMSCPHVSGAAALYLQANPTWTPAQVWSKMLADSTSGAYDHRDTRFLYVP